MLALTLVLVLGGIFFPQSGRIGRRILQPNSQLLRSPSQGSKLWQSENAKSAAATALLIARIVAAVVGSANRMVIPSVVRVAASVAMRRASFAATGAMEKASFRR